MQGARRPLPMLALALTLLTACSGGETVLGERDGVEEGDADAGDDVGHPEDTADLTDDQVDAEAEADVCVPDCEGWCGGDDRCGGTCPPGCDEGEMCREPLGICGPPYGWSQIPISPSIVAGSMAYDAGRGIVVLYNGDCSTETPCAATWEYRDAAWTSVAPPTSPPVRGQHAIVHDSIRDVVVLFGGASSCRMWVGCTSLNDTWEYDGASWVEVVPGTSPPPRHGYAMAYDSSRGVVVLFGGDQDYREGMHFLGDTWVFDGTTWTEAHPAVSPPSRTGAAMAFDSARGVAVLFGGQQYSDSSFTDTWEFDGTTWTEVSAEISPPARANPAMAYDSARAVVVLFGGQNLTASSWEHPEWTDTWEYSGTTWAEIPTPTSPRNGYHMAFDSARNRVVMFTNPPAPGEGYETWEYLGP